MFKIIKRLDKSLLITVQSSLEMVLRNIYFATDDNRDKAIDIAEYLEEHLPED